ncbi:hypothetical protein HYH02_015464 [Chlamydomonas schloesseri]|uniref:Uncharacterized protein n=1 Tax=Chlamydomonas schloesseri TaxID=2026947 RepID=A0A835S8I5_9CHLO|nr:hypothetical protein HYH02_015464 [Chlamydomonas schloesseri]|eukprot:KAG2422274.1 hypothetical protein HYH02_015464 [Chlamydomonas schloesseri]
MDEGQLRAKVNALRRELDKTLDVLRTRNTTISNLKQHRREAQDLKLRVKQLEKQIDTLSQQLSVYQQADEVLQQDAPPLVGLLLLLAAAIASRTLNARNHLIELVRLRLVAETFGRMHTLNSAVWRLVSCQVVRLGSAAVQETAKCFDNAFQSWCKMARMCGRGRGYRAVRGPGGDGVPARGNAVPLADTRFNICLPSATTTNANAKQQLTCHLGTQPGLARLNAAVSLAAGRGGVRVLAPASLITDATDLRKALGGPARPDVGEENWRHVHNIAGCAGCSSVVDPKDPGPLMRAALRSEVEALLPHLQQRSGGAARGTVESVAVIARKMAILGVWLVSSLSADVEAQLFDCCERTAAEAGFYLLGRNADGALHSALFRGRSRAACVAQLGRAAVAAGERELALINSRISGRQQQAAGGAPEEAWAEEAWVDGEGTSTGLTKPQQRASSALSRVLSSVPPVPVPVAPFALLTGLNCRPYTGTDVPASLSFEQEAQPPPVAAAAAAATGGGCASCSKQ